MLSEAVNGEPKPKSAALLLRPFVSMLLLAAAILFAGLGQGDIRIDGPIYAWAAKHMVVSGDWLNLYYDHGQTPYFNKPPLQFWLMALVFKAIGYSTFSAKLVSVLFGLGCVAMVYAIARLQFEAAVGATAGIVLATTYTFIRNTASVRLDAGVTFFFLVAIYAGARMLMSREARLREWLLLGAACGLALMIKSGAGLLCLPVLIGAFAWNRRWDLLLNWRGLVAILVCALIVLPWYIHQHQTWGQSFIDQHVRHEMVGRFEASAFGTSPWYAYLRDLIGRYWPWLPFGAFGAWQLIRARTGQPGHRLLIVWALGTLVLLHLLPRKYDRYLLFVYPALAILVAYGLHRSRFWERWKTVVLPNLGWAGVVIVVALQLAHVRLHSTAYPELAQAVPALNQARVVYALKSVPLNIQCNIRFFSNANVQSINESSFPTLQRDDILVVPSSYRGLPAGEIISRGKHIAFLRVKPGP
jgi:4-amino-4-deoxy-L-arabinose transferase-like glycosyltransferase